ncbi:MAG: gamma-glutamylcyclotransferase (GGCT)/AIG2-like uncharacterized protein YtfP [Gammaproteobacteria bacterium]
MLRIMLWKLGFEWSNLKRILHPRSDRRIYYFTFGANLSPEIINLRRIGIFESFDYVLEDAELRFSQSGFYRNHGYASADAAPGESVYGKMYLIRQSDADRMDYFEGVPFLGVHEKIFQQHQDSCFYFYRAVAPAENLKPTQEYVDYLTTAYREMDCVPNSYIKSMEAIKVLERLEPLDKTGEFVRDINRWPAILHPQLIAYEGICQRLIEMLWNRSLFDWMIKTRNRNSESNN